MAIRGILLGYESGYIIQTQSGVSAYNSISGVELATMPEGFFSKPTLNWRVNSAVSLNAAPFEVAYRTSGFSWTTDYILTLSADEKTADFAAWVSIDNRSGKKYENTKLKLIAGEVNRVSNNQAQYRRGQPMMMMADSAMAAPAPEFSEQTFSDFHLYTLSQNVTLTENSKKQLELFKKVNGISVRKYNFLSANIGGYEETKITLSNKINIVNSKTVGLGVPLPKGIVRVFQPDPSDGSLEFLGEDSISHTPANENFTLTTGNAFDLTADKIITNRVERPYLNNNYAGYTADAKLTINNRKIFPVEVELQINNPYGGNMAFTWLNSSFNLQTVSSQLYKVVLTIPASTTVTMPWKEDYRP